jgi:hypothetical protein
MTVRDDWFIAKRSEQNPAYEGLSYTQTIQELEKTIVQTRWQ